jgi:hypothetical protein
MSLLGSPTFAGSHIRTWLVEVDVAFVVKTKIGATSYLALTHQPLEDLIRRRPGDVDRLAESMLKRSDAHSHLETAEVEAWLDFDVPALSPGLL